MQKLESVQYNIMPAHPRLYSEYLLEKSYILRLVLKAFLTDVFVEIYSPSTKSSSPFSFVNFCCMAILVGH